MRSLLIAGLACAMVAPAAMARSIPNPNQRPAPGNEAPQTPIGQAGYSNSVNYELQCAGCHLGDGMGSKANDVPKMKGFVGNFLKVEGGREFLVRVPGMAQSALNDGQLAELVNWLIRKDGMAGASTPEDFKPYTADEVAQLRHKAMLNLPGTRSKLIAEMRSQGISINDGMDDY
ncbi:cytochrome C [Pseudomonas sp. NPDC078700]|uniref:cytochrome C n=1 Tax=Pseudomonas sp. NPDC078700 TaxID=3364424 RepID=UPI0037C83CB6